MIELLLQADRLLIVDMVDQAEATYRKVAEADPHNAIAVVGLARCALARGDDHEAYRLAARALRIDPQNDMARRMEARLDEVLRTRGEVPGQDSPTATAIAAVEPAAPVAATPRPPSRWPAPHPTSVPAQPSVAPAPSSSVPAPAQPVPSAPSATPAPSSVAAAPSVTSAESAPSVTPVTPATPVPPATSAPPSAPGPSSAAPAPTPAPTRRGLLSRLRGR